MIASPALTGRIAMRFQPHGRPPDQPRRTECREIHQGRTTWPSGSATPQLSHPAWKMQQPIPLGAPPAPPSAHLTVRYSQIARATVETLSAHEPCAYLKPRSGHNGGAGLLVSCLALATVRVQRQEPTENYVESCSVRSQLRAGPLCSQSCAMSSALIISSWVCRQTELVPDLQIQAIDARCGIVNDLAARLLLEATERSVDKLLRERPAGGGVRIV
jgi:hypothetical protein